MTRQYIGTTPVAASVHDPQQDVEWLFTDTWQARIHYSDMAAQGFTHLTYKDHQNNVD